MMRMDTANRAAGTTLPPSFGCFKYLTLCFSSCHFLGLPFVFSTWVIVRLTLYLSCFGGEATKMPSPMYCWSGFSILQSV